MFDLMRGAASLEVRSSMDGPATGESAAPLPLRRALVLAVFCGTSTPPSSSRPMIGAARHVDADRVTTPVGDVRDALALIPAITR
jgi:hypothetical protein